MTAQIHYKASHMYQPGAYSDDYLAGIPVEKVYEWVKVGAWNQQHFKKWLMIMQVIEDTRK